MVEWLRAHLGGQPARTAPLRHGFALGWVLSDDARQILLGDRQLQALREAGARLVRVDFRLGRHPSWDEAILGQYERVVESLAGVGVDVLGLAGHGIVPNPQQAQWTANNAEIDGGDGHNPFVDAYVTALQALARRFQGRVRLWELWNEPNVWTHQERRGAATAYSGGSYIYPSNYAAVLARAYTAVKGAASLGDSTLISGGVLGHNNGGATNAGNTGASYLHAVYEMGLRGPGGWEAVHSQFGSYPLDALGQHLYLDQGGACPPEHIQSYLGWLRQSVEPYEGANSAKPIYLTEAAWSTASVPALVHASNLTTLFRVCAQMPYVAGVLWYELRDNAAARTYYGVIDPDWTHKPAFAAFQQAASQH